jgi:hypothetical protein
MAYHAELSKQIHELEILLQQSGHASLVDPDLHVVDFVLTKPKGRSNSGDMCGLARASSAKPKPCRRSAQGGTSANFSKSH